MYANNNSTGIEKPPNPLLYDWRNRVSLYFRLHGKQTARNADGSAGYALIIRVYPAIINVPSQIHHYEQGSATILSERLWEIAEKLSVNPEDLMKKYEEDNYKAENELLSWVRESKKIDNQESRDELDIWVEFLSQRKQVYKEKIYKAEAIKVANNLHMR